MVSDILYNTTDIVLRQRLTVLGCKAGTPRKCAKWSAWEISSFSKQIYTYAPKSENDVRTYATLER